MDTKRKAGTTGYCMGGPFVFQTAAALPDRIGAAATFHGGGLVTDQPDSPHLLIPKMKAHFLIAIAENDDQKQPEAKNMLRESFAKAKLPAEIEVYAGAQHGWCPPDSRGLQRRPGREGLGADDRAVQSGAGLKRAVSTTPFEGIDSLTPSGLIFTHMGEYRKPGMDRVLGAIADPTRRAILARLAESNARITELASEFPISLNSVSKHVRSSRTQASSAAKSAAATTCCR